VSNSQPGFLDRHYLLLRRLHSLLGIFPVGVYLFPHLITNSSIMWGRWLTPTHLTEGQLDHLANAGIATDTGVEMFQHEVNFIHGLPALVLIEIGLIMVPIAFHALLGIWFALGAGANVQHYGYQGNWRYLLQRISGYIGVAFIFMHITSLRFGWTYGGLHDGPALPGQHPGRGSPGRDLPRVRPVAGLPLRQRAVDGGPHLGPDRQRLRAAPLGLRLHRGGARPGGGGRAGGDRLHHAERRPGGVDRADHAGGALRKDR
jgi:succinate dehydrogenase/fumarate reductase cytochrome b subunit